MSLTTSNVEGRPVRTGRGAQIVLSVVGACAVFLVLAVATAPSPGAQQNLAALVGLFGSAIFLFHGGSRITVAGLYGAASALFFGYSGWVVTSIDGPNGATTTVLASVALTLCGTIAFLAPAPLAVHQVRLVGASAIIFACIAAMLGLIAVRGAAPALLAEGAAFMATVVLTFAIAFGTTRGRLALLLVLPMLAVYTTLFHGGSGRLRLIGLLGCLALIVSARYPRYWHKIAAVAAVPTGLQLLAVYRLNVQSDSGTSVSSNSGLESMYAPLRAFSALVRAQAEQGWPMALGSSFVTVPFAVLPESLKPDWIPEAFNYELVALSDPELFDTGFSTAGSWVGEWWWNFGVVGVVLCAILTGPLLNALDRVWSQAALKAPSSGKWALIACGVLGVAGTVGDLAWGGSHTWIVRGIARLPLLLLLAPVVVAAAHNHRARMANQEQALDRKPPALASRLRTTPERPT